MLLIWDNQELFEFLLICFNSCNHIDHWLTLMFWWYRPQISDVVRGPRQPHSGTAHHVHHVSVSVNSIRRLKGGITAPWNIWLFRHCHYCIANGKKCLRLCKFELLMLAFIRHQYIIMHNSLSLSHYRKYVMTPHFFVLYTIRSIHN